MHESSNHALRIAVADDECDMREYFQELLSRLGHEVVGTAATGRELTGLCSRARPDLVIADIKMPEMDGLEAARSVNEERPTPFVLVSGHHELPLVERALQQYVLAYLVKPIKQVDLEVAVAVAARRAADFQALRHETAELRQSLEERKLIERAKGVVIRRLGVAEEDAFRRIRKQACDRNQKLADVAREILAAEVVFQNLESRVPAADEGKSRLAPVPPEARRRYRRPPVGE